MAASMLSDDNGSSRERRPLGIALHFIRLRSYSAGIDLGSNSAILVRLFSSCADFSNHPKMTDTHLTTNNLHASARLTEEVCLTTSLAAAPTLLTLKQARYYGGNTSLVLIPLFTKFTA